MKKKNYILNAIIWFCISGLITSFISLQIQDKYVVEPLKSFNEANYEYGNAMWENFTECANNPLKYYEEYYK